MTVHIYVVYKSVQHTV